MKLWSAALLIVFAFSAAGGQQRHSPDASWRTYGGDPGGTHFTTAAQITPANVAHLTPAWTFHTNALDVDRTGLHNASFEATPILFDGRLYVSTPFDDVFALDPATGTQLWSFHAHVVTSERGIHTSRGVAAWPLMTRNSHPGDMPCAARIFIATLDDRLIALDAGTGRPCREFGSNGVVDLAAGITIHKDEEYFFSSPPTVVGDTVIVGSGIGDNQRVNAAAGAVRAYDARTGKQLWRWEPIPWAHAQKNPTGAANAWSVISADPGHNLVFVPTGAPSPDFYGGNRPGDDRDANSVVALEATTGRRVWGFQVVHHDLWDYDVPSEPVLFTFRGSTPAVAITTKMGLLFVLDRMTGKPLYPVVERHVPVSDVPGETASPTQPFQQIATLAPTELAFNGMLGDSPGDDTACRKIISGLRYDGIYTPPSLHGTLVYPGNLGGVNWGGASVDPRTGILYANTNRMAASVQFMVRPADPDNEPFWQVPEVQSGAATFAAVLLVFVVGAAARRRWRPGRAEIVASLSVVACSAGITYYLLNRQPQPEPANRQHFGYEKGQQFGTPYIAVRQEVVNPANGHPCAPEPWGTVSAVNLNTGQAVFQTPLGSIDSGRTTGTLNLGGDLITASGLLFTAAARDPYLRAFNAATGAELWKGPLPVPAQATPMSYTIHGKQYVVIAAGGHGLFGTPQSDAVVAYALRAN